MVMGGFPTDFCGSTLILIYSVIFLAFKSIIFHLPSGQKTFSQDCEGFPSFFVLLLLHLK